MDDQQNASFSFKSLFIPFTTVKAIHWILIIGFLVYANMLTNGFVGDDNAQIVSNTRLFSLSHFFDFFRGSTFYLQEIGQSVGIYYRPLLTTSYAFLYMLFGLQPFFFHFFQLLLHITNCILLFLFFKSFIKKEIAFALSLLFLLHPINNEAVVYLANLQEEMYVFWGLLGLFLLKKKVPDVFIACCLFMSLLSKESGMVFLPLSIVYSVLFYKKSEKKRVLLLWVMLLGTFGLYGIIRVSIGNLGFVTNMLYMTEMATFGERLLTIPSILWYYVSMFFFPLQIANARYWVVRNAGFSDFWFPLLMALFILIMMIVPIILLHKKQQQKRIYVFFFAFFLAGMALTTNIIPLYVTVADRWFYMPFVGLLGMIGIVWNAFISHKKQITFISIIIVSSVLILCSYRVLVRNADWKDSFTLCQRDAQVNKTSFLLEYCVANEMYNRKMYKEALPHAEKAVTLYPTYFFSWYTLGKIYYVLGKRENAQKAFEKTLAYNTFGYGSQQLALLLVYQKKPDEAKKVIQKYMPSMQQSAELWYALALAEYQLGHTKEAKSAAQRAYQLDGSQTTYKLLYRLENNLPIKVH